MAQEIKKNARVCCMKKHTKTDQTINEREMDIVDKILDEQKKITDE